MERKMSEFKIVSPFTPTGDQPQAIEKLVSGYKQGKKEQVLLGVTGSGKTFTMANVIEQLQRPTLVIAHNKTLAAQLCSELKAFFPNNAVEYFVSYYDYYQPEAYIASTDTYIEKTALINDEIDKLRHAATAALNDRNDVIIVASVSCIYALGDPEEYLRISLSLIQGTEVDRNEVIRKLVDLQYQRSDIDFTRGTFRVRGDVLDIFPVSSSDTAIRVEFFGDEIDRISRIDPLTNKTLNDIGFIVIYPASHYATSYEKTLNALERIEADMKIAVEQFKKEGKLIEAQRIEQRTRYDLEMMREVGYCQGIENYSRYFDGRKPGEPPYTLVDYFPDDFLIIIDESHVTLPQLRGMYMGDSARKKALVEYGFRLPAAYDNRPLKFKEFMQKTDKLLYVSATPGDYEKQASNNEIVEQLIRPTWLLDPEIDVRPTEGQIDDLLGEIRKTTEKGYRTLVTTLTKRMAENLTEYFASMGARVRYMHSEIQTMERMEIIRDLRLGEFDVLVGINLLREGLDLPEVGLVAILDADKVGFLRSTTSLIQTIGRAARNAEGRVIMYADTITESMQEAINETNRRRKYQEAYNISHGTKPKTVEREIHKVIEIGGRSRAPKDSMSEEELNLKIEILREEMQKYAAELEFEQAAKVRDELHKLMGKEVEDKKVRPGMPGSKRKAYERKRK
jgi:excinuclease ABC subunit B